MTPFNFDPNIKLASLRIGVDPNAPKELVQQLRDLGAQPKDIGARPAMGGGGGGGGLNVEGAAAFDAYVMRTIKSLFCGKEAREIRFLNESGIAFHMVYADPRGQTVAKLTVPPHFCA